MPITLVGRDAELSRLAQLADSARDGAGSLLLLRGEAGVGKTALARAAFAQCGFDGIEAAVGDSGGAAYAPIIAAVRTGMRRGISVLHERPALRPHLATLVPELDAQGDAVAPDQQTLVEALLAAVVDLAAAGTLGILVDDIHWADAASVDLLEPLAVLVAKQPILVVATYRSDAVPRGHPVRRLRSALRRRGLLTELDLAPLEPLDSDRLLGSLLGDPPSPDLAASVRERSEGIPFYIEELASALVEGGSLREGVRGLELDPAAILPLPESVRDAVLQRIDRLPDDVRETVARLAVAGPMVDADVAELLVPDLHTVDRLVESGLVHEHTPDGLAFRHALIRDVVYASIPWARRREQHRIVADVLVERGAPPASIAAHCLAAGDTQAGRVSLLAAAAAFRGASAHVDAVSALSHALDLWPDGADLAGRLHALDLLADSAERCGATAQALRALAEAADLLDGGADCRRLALVQSRTAVLLELQGAWERALALRQTAASGFAVCGDLAEAAAERLAAAARLRSAGSFRAALDLLAMGRSEALRAQRRDLTLRIDALEGNVRARAGAVERGVVLVRSALERALGAGETAAAAEAYQRLADSLEHAGDYASARGTYTEAAAFCRSNGAGALGDVCLACLTMVLRQTGDWDRAVEVARAVIASPTSTAHALAVAHGVWGSILLHRGHPQRARSELHNANVVARSIGLAAMEMDTEISLARLADTEGRHEEATERCRRALKCWQTTDGERHYSIPVLRWITTFAAEHGVRDVLDAATDALTTIATQPNSEVQAALCHAVAQAALIGGDPALAATHFEQALSALADLELPFERAEIESGAARAHARAGQREEAVRCYQGAYRIARRLKVRPLATHIAEELAALGEKVERRLGRLAAAGLGYQGLSPRELQVSRLVADGRTNREVAAALSLSPRTVDMHVQSILVKLECRSRVEVARRVAEWDLAAASQQDTML